MRQLLLAVCIAATGECFGELTELVNKEGKKIKVELVSSTSGEVTVSMQNGSRKLVTFPKEMPSSESQGVVDKWKEEGGSIQKGSESSFLLG